MSLIDEYMRPCVFMEKIKTEDGAGGFETAWSEGAQFNAAITRNTTMQARIAEKEGVTSVWAITANKAVPFDYHDVIKDLETGDIFRVTSEGGQYFTPASSSLNIQQVTAEKWELTS